MKKHSYFTVQGKKFFSIGFQSHNSSSWTPERMGDTWNAAKTLGVNTVAVPIPWEKYEPEEGVWDDGFVTSIIDQAREQDLHLVMLWFGTWKNGTMEYAPRWVKSDWERFPRVQTKDGTKTLNLSPHCRVNLEADKRAFCQFMKTLKAYDADVNTVIAVQIQNEAGLFSATRRDFSVWGNEAFAQAVPQELLDWCKKYPDCELNKLRKRYGRAETGTWLEVFGKAGAEAMTAYAVARYIDEMAEAGRECYDTFLYTNAWLSKGRGLAGVDWPSGTCQLHNLDIYYAACKSLDTIAPDIYIPEVTGYLRAMDAYNRPDIDNPLYLPESGRTIFNSGMMFETVGAGTIGVHVFGGESLLTDSQDGLTEEGESMMHSFKMLSDIKPLIEKHMGTGRIHCINRRGVEPNMLIDDLEGDWSVFVNFLGSVDNYLRLDYRHKTARDIETAGNWGEPCRGLLIQDSENVFYLVGNKFRLYMVPPADDEGSINPIVATMTNFPTGAEIMSLCEGSFNEDGEFVPYRYRTGDEERHGVFANWDNGVIRIEMQKVE